MSTSNTGAIAPSASKAGELLCAWAGPVGGFLCLIGIVPLARFVPPPAPSDSARAIVARYHEHATGIRSGMILCALGFSLVAVWGAGLAARTWRSEGRYPALTFAQVALLGVSLFVGVLWSMTAQLATFRAGVIDPSITLTLDDATWFIFLIWAPFDVWLVLLAAAILLSDCDRSPLPRWTGWLTLWIALLSFPAAFIPFVKSGPLAYDGLLAWYIPAAAFFLWLPLMTWALVREINEARARGRAAEPSNLAHPRHPNQ